MPGPRQRHVEQAHILGQPFLSGLLPVLIGDVGSQVAHQPVPLRGVMKKDQFLGASLDLRILPGEQAEDHRVFEAFALVNRDDPHGVVVPLQAQLVFLGRLLFLVHLFGQPLQQAGDAQSALRFGVVQDFAEMEDVGEPALAVWEGQQALPHLLPLQPETEHPEKAVAAPELEVVVEELKPLVPLGFGAFRQLAAIHAKQVGGQGGLDQALVTRQSDAGQHPAKLGGLIGFEQAGRGVEHARDVELPQGLLDFGRLPVFEHQDGDILRLEPAPADLGVAVEQPDNLAGHHPRQSLRGQRL